MSHELFALMRENPIGTLVVILCVLWAFERMVVAFFNRNKPVVKCECDCCETDDEEEEEEEEEEE